MKAFILAAGVSRRLYPETYNIPKCLLDVGGKPIIDYQLEAIQGIGLDSVTMIIGYYREMLVEHVTKTFPDIKFNFSLTLQFLFSLWVTRMNFVNIFQFIFFFSNL